MKPINVTLDSIYQSQFILPSFTPEKVVIFNRYTNHKIRVDEKSTTKNVIDDNIVTVVNFSGRIVKNGDNNIKVNLYKSSSQRESDPDYRVNVTVDNDDRYFDYRCTLTQKIAIKTITIKGISCKVYHDNRIPDNGRLNITLNGLFSKPILSNRIEDYIIKGSESETYYRLNVDVTKGKLKVLFINEFTVTPTTGIRIYYNYNKFVDVIPESDIMFIPGDVLDVDLRILGE